MISKDNNYKKEILTIILSFFTLAVIVIVIELYSLNSLNNMNKTTNDIYNHPLKVSNAALNVRLNILKIHRDMKDIVLSKSSQKIDQILKQIDINEKEIYKNFGIIKNDILGEEGYALYVDAKNQYDNWKPIRDEVILNINNNNYEKAIHITKNKGAKHVILLEQKSDKLNRYARNKATFFKNKASDTFEEKSKNFVGITLIVLIFFIFIALYITRRFHNYASLVNNKNEELQKSNTLLEESQKIANMCSWENDISKGLIIWSDDLYEMFDLDKNSFKLNYFNIYKLIHKDDRKRVLECYKDVFENKEPYQIEYRVVIGTKIEYVLESAILKLNKNGEIDKIVGILQNITEKRLSELEQNKQLKINNKLFNNLEISIWNEDLSFIYDEFKSLKEKGLKDLDKYLKENPEYIYTLANNIKVLGINDNTLRMFNAKSKESFMSSITKTFGANAMDIFRSELFAIWNGDDYFRKEADFVTLDKKELKGIVSFSIPRERSEFTSIPVSILDVTELKEKEKFILLQSRYAAMGEMISMIAHQWRQPITTVTMIANNILADIQLEGKVDIEILENSSRDILKQTAHLSKTIDDFRSFFKMDSENMELAISVILDECISIIGSSLKNNNIEFSIDLKEDYLIYVKKGEMVQVLINIINNAKDVLVQNKIEKPKIDILIHEDREFNKLSICDNGIGIKKEIISRIFEPYFTTKENQNGTGLGLYISKVIIEDHILGKLEVENNEKAGAIFTISFPKR